MFYLLCTLLKSSIEYWYFSFSWKLTVLGSNCKLILSSSVGSSSILNCFDADLYVHVVGISLRPLWCFIHRIVESLLTFPPVWNSLLPLFWLFLPELFPLFPLTERQLQVLIPPSYCPTLYSSSCWSLYLLFRNLKQLHHQHCYHSLQLLIAEDWSVAVSHYLTQVELE